MAQNFTPTTCISRTPILTAQWSTLAAFEVPFSTRRTECESLIISKQTNTLTSHCTTMEHGHTMAHHKHYACHNTPHRAGRVAPAPWGASTLKVRKTMVRRGPELRQGSAHKTKPEGVVRKTTVTQAPVLGQDNA